jgi:hypothetical protein
MVFVYNDAVYARQLVQEMKPGFNAHNSNCSRKGIGKFGTGTDNRHTFQEAGGQTGAGSMLCE